MNRMKIAAICAASLILLAAGVCPAEDYPCDVYIRSAKIYLHTQTPPDFESALKNLLAAYDKCYDDPDLHVLLGMIYADKNQIENMAKEFSIANQQGYA
ncbi:MAG: hypothetical protein L0209_11880, partial [candidate division Zixibacteria bacterium]|nr:hypothetical protein [candidate division Zixibacteria bacterium]